MASPATPTSLLQGHEDLSLGVEFEFVVPTEKSPGFDGHPDDPRWLIPYPSPATTPFAPLAHIASLLRAAGLPCLAFGPMRGPDHYVQEAESQGVVLQPPPGPPHKYHFWWVKTDSTVSVDEFQETMRRLYGFRGDRATSPLIPANGIEVCSPVLGGGSEFEERVRRFLAVLLGRVRCLNSHTAGLHLHLSEQPSSEWTHGGITLATAKKMFSLVLLVEGMLLYRFCAPHRAFGYWCGSLARQLAVNPPDQAAPPPDMAEHIPADLHDPQLADMLLKIWQGTRFEDYKDRPAGAMVKNVGNSAAQLSRHTWTFEVRYLEGTLDPELVCRWAQVCCALLRVALLPTADGYKGKFAEIDGVLAEWSPEWTSSVGGGRRVTIRHRMGELGAFLAALGITGEDAVEFWRRKHERDCAPEMYEAVEEFLPALE